jgi:hypothetical protein
LINFLNSESRSLNLMKEPSKILKLINQLPHPKPQVLCLSNKFNLRPTTIVNGKNHRIRGGKGGKSETSG